MENLLRIEFASHYNLPVPTIANITINTDATFFEIEDDQNREIQLHFVAGNGMATFHNINRSYVTIINYDKFITSLPQVFQNNKKRCDLIVYSDNNQHFLLSELKDRMPKSKVRDGAIKQLISSLALLMSVPSICTFINNYAIKQCCFFNKQPMAPQPIIATTAFNRLNTISINGLKMSNLSIESYGFELFEYSGNQIYTIS